MKIFVYGLVFLMLSACTVEGRFYRFVNRHPELIKIDTVKIRDSIIIKQTDIEGTFGFDDVINIPDGGRLETAATDPGKLIRAERRGDSLKVVAVVKGDTIYINKYYPQYRMIYKDRPGNPDLIHIKDIALLVFLIVLLFALIRIFGQRRPADR